MEHTVTSTHPNSHDNLLSRKRSFRPFELSPDSTDERQHVTDGFRIGPLCKEFDQPNEPTHNGVQMSLRSYGFSVISNVRQRNENPALHEKK